MSTAHPSPADDRAEVRPVDLATAVDSTHAELLRSLPSNLFDLSDLDDCRRRIDAFRATGPQPALPAGVEISEQWVPGFAGAPEVRVKLYVPDRVAPDGPALLWVHGGGMVLLSADTNDFLCATRADRHGCVVASVDYRLAPEAPAPAQVHDCYAAFRWMGVTRPHGIDPDRIVIAGASAGGGLAAGTTLFMRDIGVRMPCAQLLVYPMLDHRNTTPSSHAITDLRVWNRSANLLAWDHYLGGLEPSAYSSPAICTDLSGLPPAYVTVGSLDLFLDEDVAYAVALNRAGVAAELAVFPGAFHLSQTMLPSHPLSQRWLAGEEAFLTRTLTGSA